MHPIHLSNVPSFYHAYINLVKEADLTAAFLVHQKEFNSLLNTLQESQWDYRYAPGKWSVKDLVQHVIDAERIFCYRALRFARMDKTPLAGFDENTFAVAAMAEQRSIHELTAELNTVQKSSAQMFASFNRHQLEATGVANGSSIYVEAIGYIIIGHTIHHKNILKERYLHN